MDYIKYVNIKQGTKSIKRFSRGNTLPLIQRPFGFSSFSPQTDSSRKEWFYHPDDRSFEGIRLTHQPSPWISDHGAIVIQPQSEEPHLAADRRWSGFKADETVLMPHYMRYYLTRPKAMLELTPTVYGAWMKVKFDHEYDSILTSAWKADDGSFGQFLVNYTGEQKACKIKLPENERFALYKEIGKVEKELVGTDEIIIDGCSAVLIEKI